MLLTHTRTYYVAPLLPISGEIYNLAVRSDVSEATWKSRTKRGKRGRRRLCKRQRKRQSRTSAGRFGFASGGVWAAGSFFWVGGRRWRRGDIMGTRVCLSLAIARDSCRQIFRLNFLCFRKRGKRLLPTRPKEDTQAEMEAASSILSLFSFVFLLFSLTPSGEKTVIFGINRLFLFCQILFCRFSLDRTSNKEISHHSYLRLVFLHSFIAFLASIFNPSDAKKKEEEVELASSSLRTKFRHKFWRKNFASPVILHKPFPEKSSMGSERHRYLTSPNKYNIVQSIGLSLPSPRQKHYKKKTKSF